MANRQALVQGDGCLAARRVERCGRGIIEIEERSCRTVAVDFFELDIAVEPKEVDLRLKVTVRDVGDWVSTAPLAGLVVMMDSAAFAASAREAFGVVTAGVVTMQDKGTLSDTLEKSGVAIETTPETPARSCRDSSGSRQKWRPVINRFCRQTRLMKTPENKVQMDCRSTSCLS